MSASARFDKRYYDRYYRNRRTRVGTARETAVLGGFVFEGLNPAHQRLTGLSSSEVAGREPSECLPPSIAAAVEERYRRCVEAGVPLRYQETLELPAGLRDWETSLAPVRDPASGRIVRLVAPPPTPARASPSMG